LHRFPIGRRRGTQECIFPCDYYPPLKSGVSAAPLS
jgi:hypothetical protein